MSMYCTTNCCIILWLYGQEDEEDLAVPPSLASSEAVWKSASTINEVVKLTLAISVVREVFVHIKALVRL